jgi:hypothetical protein
MLNLNDGFGEGFRMPARGDLSARTEGRRPKPFTIADTQLTPPEPSGGCLVFGERPSQPSGVFAVREAGMYR